MKDNKVISTDQLRKIGVISGWTAAKYDIDTFERTESNLKIKDLTDSEQQMIRDFYSQE